MLNKLHIVMIKELDKKSLLNQMVDFALIFFYFEEETVEIASFVLSNDKELNENPICWVFVIISERTYEAGFSFYLR